MVMQITKAYNNYLQPWKKLLGHALKNNQTKNKYGIKAKCATTENPQANSILERIHQVTEKLVHKFDLQKNYLDEDDPWAGILVDIDFWYRARTIPRCKPHQYRWFLDVK